MVGGWEGGCRARAWSIGTHACRECGREQLVLPGSGAKGVMTWRGSKGPTPINLYKYEKRDMLGPDVGRGRIEVWHITG